MKTLIAEKDSWELEKFFWSEDSAEVWEVRQWSLTKNPKSICNGS